MVNAFLFFLLCYIVYTDMAMRKIYNKVIVFLAFLSLFLHFSNAKWVEHNLMSASLCFFGVLIFLLFFYKVGLMGGGDVKLGSMLAFIFGLNNFLWVWVVSIVFLIIYAVFVKIICAFGYEVIGLKLVGGSNKRRYIPYGAFLSISSMLLILKSEAAI